MRGVCVQCAAILMIEDQDGPNIVVQNSHTVLVTSLFCVKIAHELRAVYAGVYARDAQLVIALEAKVGDQFVDAFLGIEDVVAVFVENTMSESKPNRVNDVDRVKKFVERKKTGNDRKCRHFQNKTMQSNFWSCATTRHSTKNRQRTSYFRLYCTRNIFTTNSAVNPTCTRSAQNTYAVDANCNSIHEVRDSRAFCFNYSEIRNQQGYFILYKYHKQSKICVQIQCVKIEM